MTAGRILVVCKGDRSLDILDLGRGQSVGRVVSSGICPHEVAPSVDGTVGYLPVYSDAPVGVPGSDGQAIDVIDLVRMARRATVKIPFASRPHLPLLGPDGMLYVSTELDESISIFDPGPMRLVTRLPTGARQSHMFALSRDGQTIAVANVQPGTVSVIDLGSRSLRGTVEVAASVNRIAFDGASRLAYTANQGSPRLAAIDTRDLRVADWIDLPGIGFGSAVTPNGRTLVVALRQTSQIAIIDLPRRSIAGVVDVPPHPQAIVVHPSGRYAYSACDDSNLVVELDIDTRRVERLIHTGRNPDGLSWSPTPPVDA